jgi:hypothetical protein
MTLDLRNFAVREELEPRDRRRIFNLLNESGFFLPREMAYGMDLFDAQLPRQSKSVAASKSTRRSPTGITIRQGAFSMRAAATKPMSPFLTITAMGMIRFFTLKT